MWTINHLSQSNVGHVLKACLIECGDELICGFNADLLVVDAVD